MYRKNIVTCTTIVINIMLCISLYHHRVQDDQAVGQVGGGVMRIVIQGHGHHVNNTMYRLLNLWINSI